VAADAGQRFPGKLDHIRGRGCELGRNLLIHPTVMVWFPLTSSANTSSSSSSCCIAVARASRPTWSTATRPGPEDLCRLGHRLGYIPDDITTDFEMPRVPKTIVPTFSDEQLHRLLAVPDRRTWMAVRVRAILLVLLDTLIRVSELVGLDAEDVDLDEGVIRVMG
jgi:hypothetical protein